MSAVDQLELFLRDMLERPAWLFLHRRLQPLEIASALTKEIDSQAEQMPASGALASAYEILIADSDYRHLEPMAARLEQEFAAYVHALADERPSREFKFGHRAPSRRGVCASAPLRRHLGAPAELVRH
jgi:hypothetical protein